MLPFPEIRALMGKYGVNLEKMGSVMGCNYMTVSNKLNGHSEFKFSEMVRIMEFFSAKGEDVSVEFLFFGTQFAKANYAKIDTEAR